jgi:invasion protein IalB
MLRSSRSILISVLLLSAATTQAMAQASEPSAEDTAAAMEQLRRATMPGGQPANAAAATLPNGASAINEVYEDWTVDCRLADGRKVCRLSQAQGNSQTGRRVFAIELDAPRNGRAEGTVLMPLGVKLDAGAIMKLDDKTFGQGLRFSVCASQGCIAAVTLPAAGLDSMRKSQNLTIASLGLSNNEPVVFKISLKGFAAANARIAQLDN